VSPGDIQSASHGRKGLALALMEALGVLLPV
jgi:hypothetical protein